MAEVVRNQKHKIIKNINELFEEALTDKPKDNEIYAVKMTLPEEGVFVEDLFNDLVRLDYSVLIVDKEMTVCKKHS